LVAANGSDHFAFAQTPGEPSGDRLQHKVANRIAERIVDFVEMVEIDQEHFYIPSANLARTSAVSSHSNQTLAVCQIGEWVVMGRKLESEAWSRLCGQILEDRM